MVRRGQQNVHAVGGRESRRPTSKTEPARPKRRTRATLLLVPMVVFQGSLISANRPSPSALCRELRALSAAVRRPQNSRTRCAQARTIVSHVSRFA